MEAVRAAAVAVCWAILRVGSVTRGVKERLIYSRASGNGREKKHVFVTNESASMRYSLAGGGGGCGSECNIVHPRATAKPITHGRRASTHARARVHMRAHACTQGPRQSAPWIGTPRTLNPRARARACACVLCAGFPGISGPCVHRFSRDPPPRHVHRRRDHARPGYRLFPMQPFRKCSPAMLAYTNMHAA